MLYSNETKGVEAANGKTIALKFVRKMSKITLDMTKDETIESFEGLKVEMKGIATEGKFDLAKGTVKATDGKNTQAVAMNIGNVEASTAKATAIILPTAAATDQTKMDLTFTLAGKTFTHSIADLTAFEAGKNVTFKATLSINNGKPVVTVGNATIKDWVGVAGGDFDVNFDGEGGGTQPGEEKVLLDEPFDANQGNFTISDIKLPEGSTYVWQWGQFDKDNTQYMKASANINKVNHAAESWLISPSIDLTSAKKATLTFEHCHKYGADKSKEMTLWVADAGTQASAEATGWTQVVIPAYGSGNDYKYVSATIDLTAYVGKSVQVAFRYVSTADAAALWQINSVKVVADGKGGTVDPTPEPEPEPEPQPQPTPSGTELYISEYVEGTKGSNKFIEIYNPTDKEIDLSAYVLNCASNGKTWGNETSYTYQQLEGTIAPKSVIVYQNAKADLYTSGKPCNACGFNGEKNDAVGLFKGGVLIDVFGYPVDPNSDPNFGKDITYRRKASVSSPVATFNLDEWEAAAADDVSGLGKR